MEFSLAYPPMIVVIFCMGHEIQDSISLELARRVAMGLPQHPEWIEVAHANLERWSRLNAKAPALLRSTSKN
jgi:hypothetical protein